MELKKRIYSQEFKIKAVELSNHRGGSLNQVALELNIPVKNLSRWKQEYRLGILQNGADKGFVQSKETIENIALRKALKDAQIERDILKKALSIFSKSDR
jgi:transposase